MKKNSVLMVMFKQNESIAFTGINEPITYMNEEEITNGYSFIFAKVKTKKRLPNVLKEEKYQIKTDKS